MTEPHDKQSDSSEGVLAKLEAAAREHGIRSVVAIIGAGAYVVNVPGAPGIVTLDGGATELYERLEAEGQFGDAAAARDEHASVLIYRIRSTG